MFSIEEQQHLLQLTKKLLEKSEWQANSETVSNLRTVIKFHDWCYYVLSEQKITDFDYDFLFSKLKELERFNPTLVTEDSPTQRVARGLTENFETVTHLTSMLSLENSYNEGDLLEFDRRVKDLVGEAQIQYCVEPKFDGASIALVYENNRLVRAATRGDGTVGEDITNNAKALASIPLTANFSSFGISKIEIRGEVIIKRDVFEKMNEQRAVLGEKTFQNPRNTASGSLRLKNPEEVRNRRLEAILYHVSFAEDSNGNNLALSTLKSHYHCIEILMNCGFVTPLHELKLCNSVQEILNFLHIWNEKRNHFNIDTDGMVLKVNSLAQQNKCGSTSHHPRWAMAYKFAAKRAESKLLKVEFQVGRTGAITPVAKIEPVPLAGVTISSISLHNEDFIKEKDIRLCDTVIVERAGEVIPYIVGSVKKLRTGEEIFIEFPKNCPSCNTPLVKPEEEAVWRCDNADCPAQTEERTIHFASKDAMDIEGLGRSIVIDFIERKFIQNIENIYSLPYQEILDLEGWGKKSVENLQAGIETSKNQPLWRLINALGIRLVGVSTSKDLASHLNNIFELSEKNTEWLTNIEGIGPKVAQSIVDFFSNKSNVELLHHLKAIGVNTENRVEDALSKNNKLEGKTFLFTGSLQKFTRDRAKQLVEENGGKLLSSVSANLNFLVVGKDAGSKLTKAQKIDSIQIIDEDSFLKMVE
ncbi:MAG: NAD-dependent DNA ligase LigA [Chitinophagales bacterium]|nr:NAD-dependent DNA ligase LigA [Chitinophagales bacterium]